MNITDTNLLSLSNKVKAHVKSNRTWPDHVDTNVTGQDLQYNLSPIIADLVVAQQVEPLKKADIERIIINFNSQNATEFDTAYFLSIGWLRLINERFVIPSVISTHLMCLDKPALFPNTKTPPELESRVQCMLEIYRSLKSHSKTSVDENTLTAIIQKHSPALDLSFLEERKIIGKTTEGRYCYQYGNNYADQLKNRIVASGWFKLTEEAKDIHVFRKFIRFIGSFGRFPDSLPDLLPHSDIQQIREFSQLLLTTEPDLADTALETLNDRLDDPSYKRTGLTPPIPKYSFGQEPYVFLQQMKHYRFYDHDLFDHEETRHPYILLIRFLVQFDYNYQQPYHDLKEFFKSNTNPYIRWQLLWTIKNTFPEVLAYFLNDHQLAPVVFETIDQLTIKDEWLKKNVRFEDNLALSDRLKNELWMEAFNCYTDMAVRAPHPADFGKGFAVLLQDLAQKVFRFNSSNYYRSADEHNSYRARYDQVLKKLTSARMVLHNHYPAPRVKPLLSAYILPEIVDALEHFPDFTSPNEFLKLNTGKIDLYIELLRIAGSDFSNKEVYQNAEPELYQLEDKITELLYHHLIDYFKITEVTVNRYMESPTLQKPKRGVGDFGIEILDLAYLFLNFQKRGLIAQFDQEFKATLTFKPAADSYDIHNREEAQKVAFYLKMLLTGYIELHTRKETHELKTYAIDETLSELEVLIADYALSYKKDDPAEAKVDIFSPRQYFFSQDLYNQPLTALLYQALNGFPVEAATSFINNYFDGSKELDKLFTALNRIDDKNIKAILTGKIENIDCDAFIDEAFTVTELEAVLLEIVNSRTLYRFADPFLKSVEAHAEKRKINTPEKRLFLYRIKLLLALKRKETDTIRALEIPKDPLQRVNKNEDENSRKQFYLGLDQLYNKKDYKEAIRYFTGVSGQYPFNPEYAYYLYQACAFQDIQDGKPSDAQLKWETFKNDVPADEKVKLNPFYDMANSLDLLYYAWRYDDIKFDQTINTLPPVYLYQEQLIVTVYNNYVRRGMPELGYEYLNKAIAYLKENGVEINEELETLKVNAVDETLVERVRQILGELRNLPADAIPRVLPKTLNSQRKLNEFILGEIVNGLKVMRKKIKAVESIIKEDHYNDVFLATLRLRLPVFGWDIADQERTGPSKSALDAGEADVTIKSSGNDIAILEALKMKGKDFNNLEIHVKKIGEYVRDLKNYYMVVYYYGERENYSDFIKTYQKDIADINYSANWTYDITTGFTDLNRSFNNTENIYLGKTQHGTNQIQLYHIIIDLSQAPPLVKDDGDT